MYSAMRNPRLPFIHSNIYFIELLPFFIVYLLGVIDVLLVKYAAVVVAMEETFTLLIGMLILLVSVPNVIFHRFA